MKLESAFCLTVLVVPLLTGCGGDYDFVQDLQSVDGNLYLVSSGGTMFWGPFSFGEGARTRILRSGDGGQSWEMVRDRLRIGQVLFTGASCALATEGDRLLRSRDGGRSFEVLSIEEPIRSLQDLHGRVAALSDRSAFLSSDCGTTWERVQPGNIFGIDDARPWSPVSNRMARDGEQLALATRFGRVYLGTAAEDQWDEVILGSVSDLAFHRGQLYAVTGMGTLTLIDPPGFEHLRTDLDPTHGRFYRCGEQTLFLAGQDLYRLDGENAVKLGSAPVRQAPGFSFLAAPLDTECSRFVVVERAAPANKMLRFDVESGKMERLPPLKAGT